MVDVLRLDQRLEVVLQDFGEVVLELGSAEIFQDFLPIWRVLQIDVNQAMTMAEMSVTERKKKGGVELDVGYLKVMENEDARHTARDWA